MIINRHNYEEFFILYLDNELSSEDRSRVELFVQENPDLQEELNMLQQTLLVADTSLVFDGKESLMKSAADCNINMSNYEQWLLLYIDDELTTEQEIAVENFAVTHPAVKTTLDILQKTKLKPEETIVYFNKESLYRKEETTRRVIPIRWWRVAAAAILISIAGVSVFYLVNNQKPVSTEGPVAIITPGSKNAAGNNVLQKADTKTLALDKPNQNPENKNNEQIIDQSPEKINSTKVRTQKNSNNALSTEDNNNGTTVEAPEMSYQPRMNGSIGDKNAPIAYTPLTIPKEINSTSDVTNMNGLSFDNRDVVQTGNTIEEESTFDSEKKTKFRGLLRKITRTFEKTTNIKATDGEDRLLVGGLAIRL
jgi:hypothetical protein